MKSIIEKDDFDSPWRNCVDGGKYPLLVTHGMGMLEFFIGDPNMVKELMTTKNLKFDKSSRIEHIVKPLMGKSFLFSPADAHWKKMRKAC